MLIIGGLREPFGCCFFTIGFTGFTEAEVEQHRKQLKKESVLPYNLGLYFATFGTYTYYFGKLFEVIFQASTFASDSGAYLSIQCKEEGKKSQRVPEA